MYKRSILLALLLCSIISFSQEIVNSTPVALKKGKSVFQIVNDFTKETTLFISDKEKVKAIRLNSDMQIIDSLSTERLNPKLYVGMIGYNEDKSNINLFWTSSSHKDIFIQQFNFDKPNSENKTYTLSLKDEKFVQPFSLQKIRPENPTSLVESSKRRKCYSNGNTIVITFDSNLDYTQLITLDLDNFKASEKFIKKPYISYTERYELNSNSFLIHDHLYQIKSSSNQLILTMKDLQDNLIKSYEALDENPIIDFKNSNYVQENGGTTKTRILDTSSQFIRKINNLTAGISCYKLNDNYLVTIGSVSQEQQQASTGAIVGGMFGAIGSIAGSMIDAAISNPTMESFNAYANRKVVYINGLFDKDANHIKGEIDPLAFDKIRVFFEKDTNVSSQTLYKLDNVYYFGYYDNTTKEYTIRKFKD